MLDTTASRVKVLHEIAREFAQEAERTLQGRLISVCLFGSVAREEGDSSSDIDILVIAEDLPESLLSRNMIIKNTLERVRSSPRSKILRKMGQSTLVSPVLLTPEEASKHPPIMLDMVDSGVILYDRDWFLQGVLDDIRRRLNELGARKVRTQKGWYWILKPDARLGEEVRI